MLNTFYCNVYRPFKKYKFREKLLHKKSTLIIRYNFINTKFKNHLSLNIGYIITPHCLWPVFVQPPSIPTTSLISP